MKQIQNRQKMIVKPRENVEKYLLQNVAKKKRRINTFKGMRRGRGGIR